MANLGGQILFYLGMDQSALIDKKTLARALSISLRTVTTLVSTKRIPVIRITRKIVRFNLPEVMAALGRPEVP